ncbi:MAG: HD domain-containing protein [Thaumarchaeota archaeon]|nr:HD domain-containing protein [Nitrososphaerota archaeon]
MDRIEIRDPVHGYVILNELERKVIDSPVFQRLRRIRQLAGAYLAYPGAQHTRFEHSIGCLYLAGLTTSSLSNKVNLTSEDIQEVRIASLLHDIGHGPFSHLFDEILVEKAMIRHEDLTERIIGETDIRDILNSYGINHKEISRLALGQSKKKPKFMNDIVAGILSVDSMDYLLRDSYFTGVEYGKVDVQRLINSFEVVNESLALDQASLYAFEALMIARYEMFKAVYFHRTVRAGGIMLLRAMSLSDETLGFTDLRSIQKYLTLGDDVALQMMVDLSPKGNEQLKTAKKLAKDYQERNLLKCVYERLVHRNDKIFSKIFSQIGVRKEITLRIASSARVNPDDVYVDVPTAPSVPLTSERKTMTSLTLVSKSAQGNRNDVVRLENMPLIGSIVGFMDIIRVYTTRRHRLPVERAANEFFGNEQSKKTVLK